MDRKEIDIKIGCILGTAFDRYNKGELVYGVFDPEKDPRDFLKETEEELLDVIVYAAFQITRLKEMAERIKTMTEGIEQSDAREPTI